MGKEKENGIKNTKGKVSEYDEKNIIGTAGETVNNIDMDDVSHGYYTAPPNGKLQTVTTSNISTLTIVKDELTTLDNSIRSDVSEEIDLKVKYGVQDVEDKMNDTFDKLQYHLNQRIGCINDKFDDQDLKFSKTNVDIDSLYMANSLTKDILNDLQKEQCKLKYEMVEKEIQLANTTKEHHNELVNYIIKQKRYMDDSYQLFRSALDTIRDISSMLMVGLLILGVLGILISHFIGHDKVCVIIFSAITALGVLCFPVFITIQCIIDAHKHGNFNKIFVNDLVLEKKYGPDWYPYPEQYPDLLKTVKTNSKEITINPEEVSIIDTSDESPVRNINDSDLDRDGYMKEHILLQEMIRKELEAMKKGSDRDM